MTQTQYVQQIENTGNSRVPENINAFLFDNPEMRIKAVYVTDIAFAGDKRSPGVLVVYEKANDTLIADGKGVRRL